LPLIPINSLITMTTTPILAIKKKSMTVVILWLLLSQLCPGQTMNNAKNYTTDTTKITQKVELKDVIVKAKLPISRNNTYQYSPDRAKSLITVLGGTDVMRYIGTLPGVSQGMEGGMGFFVRGSNTGNNRVELDEVPVYGSTHLFGLFSTFHPSIVQSTDFRTGGIPASSGDFLASIAQITSINPDSSKYHGKLNVSPFLAGISASGPITKKLGFIAAGRISLLRPEYLLIKSITKTEDSDINPQISDSYIKLNYEINQKHHLSASGYASNDYFKFEMQTAQIVMNWGNEFVRLGWDWNITNKTKLHTVAYYNHFYSGQLQRQYTDNERIVLSSELRVQTALTEKVIQSKLEYKDLNWSINVGIILKNRLFQPATEKLLVGDESISTFNNTYNSQSYTGFGEIKYKYNKLLTSFGLRENLYQINGHSMLLTDIRFNSTLELTSNSGLELSYDLLSQTHHSLEGLPVGWSLDLLIPADSHFRPEISNQLYGGGYWANNLYNISAGIYYKHMANLVSYKNAINVFGVQNTSWQDEITIGQGDSYGLEFRAERKTTNWNTAISYTLSKTTRQFDAINDGKVFPFKFDRRNILNANVQFLTLKSKEKEQHINIALSYSSGHKVTIPIGEYKGITPPYWDLMNHGTINSTMDENAYYRQLMTEENNYTMPYYFRIDIGYSFLRTRKKYTSEFTLGVYNVLNRKNPYLVFYQDSQWKQLSILPLIPSIEWTIGF